MLEHKLNPNISTDKFFSQTVNPLGQEAEIRATRPEISMVCKDMDEVTTKEEVCEGLKRKLNLIGLAHKLASSAYQWRLYSNC